MKLSRTMITAAVILSILEFTVMFWKIYIPIPNMDIVMDPGELFITLGAAYAGGIGMTAVVLARTAATLLKGDLNITLTAVSFASHITAAWGFFAIYRIYNRKEKKTIKQLLLWAFLVAVYYLFLMALFHTLSFIFMRSSYLEFFSPGTGFIPTYLIMVRIYTKELLFTLLLSTTVLYILPPGKDYR